MSITLDGTVYWIHTGALKGVGESDAGTILAWATVGDNDGAAQYLFSINDDRLSLQRNASNKIVVTGKNSSGTTILTLTSDTSYTSASTTWLGILASWDLSAGVGYLYINRAADLASSTLTSGDVDLNSTPVGFGARSDATLGWVGSVEELVFWDGKYLDISDSDEIIKLTSSDGVTDFVNPGPNAGVTKPVGLGAQASQPFYQPAAVIFSGAFTDNRGTGGDFAKTGSFSWVAIADDIDTYRQSSTPDAIPGQRSFDSDKTGLTYPRHKTYIEKRPGHRNYGQRLGIAERSKPFRDEYPGRSGRFRGLLYQPEDDSEDRRV